MDAKIPFQVGLTGGIGSGKSVVAKLFQLFDVPFYESDLEAKMLYLQPEIKERVVELLGKQAYDPAGNVDTRFIAKEIYGNSTLRLELNQIIHPAVGLHYQNWLKNQTHPYVLKVAALLFEADIARKLDFTLLVVAPGALKESRILERDPFRSKEEMEKIFQSQWSDEEKRKRADGIINNSEDDSLIGQVHEWDLKFKQGSSFFQATGH